MSRAEGIKRAATFTVVVCLVACLAGFTYHALGGRIGRGPWFGLMGLLYMWIPAGTAIVLQKWLYKEGVVGPLGISFKINRWWLVGLVVPPVAMYLAFGFSLLMPQASLAMDLSGVLEKYRGSMPPEQFESLRQHIRALPPYFGWIALLLGAIPGVLVGATVNAVGGFGEELGWRGFLQKTLGFMGFWRSSFTIGIIWGLWHAPVVIQGVNYPQHPWLGILMMTLAAVLLAPILAYVRLQGKSVVAAAVTHGTFNATAGLSFLLIRGGSELTVGINGLAGMLALALINLGIFFYDRRLAKEECAL